MNQLVTVLRCLTTIICRTFSSTFFLCSLLVSSAVAALVWVTLTEQGLQSLWTAISPLVQNHVKIEEISGKLHNKIYIRNLSFDSSHANIKISEASLNWQPLKLLSGKLIIHELTFSEVDLTLKRSETTKKLEEKKIQKHSYRFSCRSIY